MGKLLNAEAIDAINEAVEKTLHEFPDARKVEGYLKTYIHRRWPYVIKAAISVLLHTHEAKFRGKR